MGTGCKSCKKQYENVKEAVRNMELSADIEYITEADKIVEYGVMNMPAVIIDKRVVSSGRVMKPADL